MNCVYLWLWWLNKFTRYTRKKCNDMAHVTSKSCKILCECENNEKVYGIGCIYRDTDDIIWKWLSQVCWQDRSSETVTNKRLIEAIRKRFVKRRKVFVVYLFSKLSSFIINISWWNIWNFCWCCRPLSV